MGPELLAEYEKPIAALRNGHTTSQPSIIRVQTKKVSQERIPAEYRVEWQPTVKLTSTPDSRRSSTRCGSVHDSFHIPTRYKLDAQLASKVGKYTLSRTLGRGNFAQVKLATHFTTGSEVAIKMIDKSTLNETCQIKLSREVRVLKTLSHPNIIRLYEVIETTRHVYLVTEYAKNGELFDHLLKVGRLTESKARSLIRQLFSAVEYCHQKNIVHRDLKAENLLLDEDNNVKLADFGFANTFDSDCSLDTFCGSPPYAAPELLSGQKYHGPEVDVWAMGVILYMLVCGQLPFEARTLKELHVRVTSGEYQLPFYVSKECCDMLKKMLVIDPTKRSDLKELMNETWINMGYEDDVLRPYKEPPINYCDPIRTAIMNELGFEPEQLKDAFENKRFNNVTATYLLLADTGTRHKLTQRLQSREQYEAYAGRSARSTEVESSSDEDCMELVTESEKRFVSRMSHSGQVLDGRSKATGSNWATVSFRKVGLTRDSLEYTTDDFIRGHTESHRRSADDQYTALNGSGVLSLRRSKLKVTIERENPKETTSPRTNGLQRPRASASLFVNCTSKAQNKKAEVNEKKPIPMEQRFKTDPPSRHNFQVSIRRLKSSGSRIGSTTVTPESSRTSLDTKWRLGHRSLSMAPPSRSWSTGRGDLFDMLNPTEREKFIARNNSVSQNGLVRLSSVNRAMHANHAKKQLKCGSIQGPGSSESSFEEGFRQKCKELEVDCGNLIHVIPSRCNNELSKVQEKQNQLQNFGNEGRMPSWRKQTMQNKQKREKVAKDSFLEVYSNRKNDFSVARDPVNDMRNITPQTPSPGMSPQTQARNNFSNCRWNGLYTSANSSQHQRSKPTFTIPLNSNKNINNQPPPTTMRGNRQSAEEVDISSIRRRTGTEQATVQRSRQRASLVPIGSRCPLDGRESSNGRIAVANVASVFNECAAAMEKKSVAQTDPDIKFTTSRTSLQQLDKSLNGVLSPAFSARCITVEQTHRTDSRKDKDDGENHMIKGTGVMRLLDSQQSTETGSRSKVTSSKIHSPNQEAALDKLCASSVSPRRCNLALGIRIMGRNAQTLMSSLNSVLESKGIYYTHVNPYRVQCTATIPQGGSNKIAGTVKWESEIVQLPRLRTYGVRFKHTSGDNSHYRYFEKMITEQFPRADD